MQVCSHFTYKISYQEYNALRFDSPPSRTNSLRGQHTIRIATTGAEKKGFTVALCAYADGTKLPAMMILKEKNGVLGPRVKANLRLPTNVVVAASPNGWMTRSVLHSWFRRVTLYSSVVSVCWCWISTGLTSLQIPRKKLRPSSYLVSSNFKLKSFVFNGNPFRWLYLTCTTYGCLHQQAFQRQNEGIVDGVEEKWQYMQN